MALPASLRSLIPLVLGLAVGAVGVTLFSESLPGAKGSAEERAQKLEADLKRAQNQIAALEAQAGTKPRSNDRTLADGARTLTEALREGRAVSPDDIFRASQPLLRDLAPLFDRMRLKQQREMVDSLTGELARKYHLSAGDQAKLKGWFEQKTEEEAKRWTEMVTRDGTRLEDIMRASQEVRPDEGLDAFMTGVLSGDQLTAFQNERMAERVTRVEQEADLKVQRLDSIVKLDEAQRDQVYGVMARGSRDYDPAMALEGATGPIGSTPGGDRQAAMLTLLRPDQRAAYDGERQRQRDEASKNMEAIGLTLPADWDMFDGDFFR